MLSQRRTTVACLGSCRNVCRYQGRHWLVGLSCCFFHSLLFDFTTLNKTTDCHWLLLTWLLLCLLFCCLSGFDVVALVCARSLFGKVSYDYKPNILLLRRCEAFNDWDLHFYYHACSGYYTKFHEHALKFIVPLQQGSSVVIWVTGFAIVMTLIVFSVLEYFTNSFCIINFLNFSSLHF